MYDRILIPTDGSEAAERAVTEGLDLAECLDSDVVALYVVDTAAVDFGSGSEQAQRIRVGKFGDLDSLEAAARAATEYLADRARERGLAVEELYRVGRPAATIVDVANAEDVDLVAMQSQFRSGLERVLHGSVTQAVVRKCDRSVLVVDGGGGSLGLLERLL